MIITCPCKKKRFEVDSSLIPENGRTIQCGSCDHVWFYTPEIKNTPDQPASKISKTDNFIIKNNKDTNNETTSKKTDQNGSNKKKKRFK